jgi:hypothetical protein
MRELFTLNPEDPYFKNIKRPDETASSRCLGKVGRKNLANLVIDHHLLDDGRAIGEHLRQAQAAGDIGF